jgi:hypothetical protein
MVKGFLFWFENTFGCFAAIMLYVFIFALFVGGCNAILDLAFSGRTKLRNSDPAPYNFERDPFDGSSAGHR